MTEHRDSLELEPEQAGEVRASSTRRFARLVESPVARRVALPRLLLAIAILFSLVILVGLGGSKLVLLYVSSQADYQLRFSDIELIPAPEPWVRGGKSLILEQVRAEANHGETLSLLDLDLDGLKTDFKRCPWVNEVIRIERSYRRLTVHLTYRKPVAVVVLGKIRPIAYPIDEEAVYLPDSNIEWIADESPFQVWGFSRPLIEIQGVETSTPPRFGVQDRDPMVLRAARLAEFLQSQRRTTPSGRVVPTFVSIHIPDEPGHPFLLKDSKQNWVSWGKPPGDEKSGEPSSEARWKMLLDWVDRNGPLNAKKPSYLYFNRTEAMLFDGGPPKKPFP